MNLLKKYLLFFKEQEAIGEPFHDKVGQLNNFYLPIADYINKNVLKKKRTFVIGLAGGQGSGKSTISQILKLILQYKYKLSTVIFSIDDIEGVLRTETMISLEESVNDKKRLMKNIFQEL